MAFGRPTPKSAETRARIVEGALRALELFGLGETTTRRIAAAAGVRLATVHYHFDSKDSVLLAVFDALILELTVTLAGGSNAARTLDDRIDDLIGAAWSYAEATRAKQIVHYELTLHALRSVNQDWFAARQYEAYVDAYAAALDSPEEAPLDEAGLRDVARFVLAGVDGLILQSLAGAPKLGLRAGLATLSLAARTRAASLAGGRAAAPVGPGRSTP